MAKDPAASAQMWAQNLSAATAKITAGVQAVTVAPGAAAAKQKSVWLANLQAAADKWARNVGAVSLSTWQNDMINKGIPRIATGAQGSVGKMQAFLTAFIPFVENGRTSLPPRGGLEANIQRAVAMIRHNAGFTYRRPNQ